jgi:hypothetical protein
MAGRPLRRARALAETIARTGGDPPKTEGIACAELAADAAAVVALLEHHGNALTALRLIAPNIAALPVADQRAIARRTFAGNRFTAMLRDEIDRERRRLISRAVSIALDRQHPDAAIRAIDTLARVGGWYASTKRAKAPSAAVPPANSSIVEALALMEHEPAGATATPFDWGDE